MKFLGLLLASSTLLLALCGGIHSAESGVAGGSSPTKTSSKSPSLVIIGEDDWEQILVGEWMVEFHAPWCPACRSLQPEWKKFSSWSSDLGVKVGAVDVTANPGLSGRFMVTALPTIYHVIDGVFRQYKGARDLDTFVGYIEDKKWQTVEPVPSWKAPNSFQMSIVSQFFKISMAIRSVHNSLVEDYGIPYWGSYVLFAFATILVGAVLGLMVVCLIDVVCPTQLNAEARAPPPAPRVPDSDDDLFDGTDSDEVSGEEEEGTVEEGEDDEEEEEEGGDDKPQAATSGDAVQTDEDSNQKNLRKRRARRADD